MVYGAQDGGAASTMPEVAALVQQDFSGMPHAHLQPGIVFHLICLIRQGGCICMSCLGMSMCACHTKYSRASFLLVMACFRHKRSLQIDRDQV